MHHKSRFVKTPIDISKYLFAKFICFKHMSELKYGSCIRHLLFIEIDMHKGTHGITVIDRIFDSFVRKIKPNLHEVHAKHGFNTNSLTTAFIVEIKRPNYFNPVRPWDKFFHGIKNSSRLVFFLRLEYSTSENVN